MKKRTNLQGLSNSRYMQYAVGRTGVDMPNCFTYATARISEIVGYNQPLDNVKVRGAGDLFNNHHSNFKTSKYAVPGALMIWTGGYLNYGHVAVCEDIIDNNTVAWSQSNYGGPSFEYITGNPNTMYAGLTFAGYLVHKNLNKSPEHAELALIKEHAVAVFNNSIPITIHRDDPNGSPYGTMSKGEEQEYTHKYVGNGHRYIVWKHNGVKCFCAVSGTEKRPEPNSDDEWATFKDVGVDKPITPDKPIKPSDGVKPVVPVTPVKAHGIDISEFNGDIDVKGQDFVIIKATWGENEDPMFRTNVKKCQDAGIPFGVYHFSYALNAEQAQAEIKFFLNTVKDLDVQCGYWLDLEENSWWTKHKCNTPEHVTMVAKNFEVMMNVTGLYYGIYAGKYWFDNFIKTDVDHKWIADWGNDDSIRDRDLSAECVLHQYTSNGNTLDEIVSYVDLSTLNYKKDVKKSNKVLLDEIMLNVQELKERLG